MATSGMKSIGVALLPFTPVTFDGPDALYAWARVLLYGAGASLMWKRHRPTAYALAGAAGLSLLTSLSGTAYAKGAPEKLAVEPATQTPIQAEIDRLTAAGSPQ